MTHHGALRPFMERERGGVDGLKLHTIAQSALSRVRRDQRPRDEGLAESSPQAVAEVLRDHDTIHLLAWGVDARNKNVAVRHF